MALSGTPAGSSQAGSMEGQLAAGAVKRELGCAAGVLLSGVQGWPRQSVMPPAGDRSHAFPPHVAVGGQRHVGEDGVLGQAVHGVGIGFPRRAGSHAEEAGFGIDGAQAPVRSRFDPGDVVPDGGGPSSPSWRAAAPAWRSWSCRIGWERPRPRRSFRPPARSRPG